MHGVVERSCAPLPCLTRIRWCDGHAQRFYSIIVWRTGISELLTGDTLVRVFILDDDADIVDMLVEVVNRERDLCVHGTGAMPGEALNGFSSSIDVMLCDIQMPQMSGPETVRILRDRGFEFEVVYMTGGSVEKVGPGAVVTPKPFDFEKLMAQIRKQAEKIGRLIPKSRSGE